MQPSLFNRARYRNPNRCAKSEHIGRTATHRVTGKTSNPRNPVQTFDVCSTCARPWESVPDVMVKRIEEAQAS